MSELKTVHVYFKGSREQIRYSGDGIECDIEKKETRDVMVTELKAYQLLTDFPGVWELPDFKGKPADFIKGLGDIEHKKIAAASATKSVRVIDEFGKEHKFPPGVRFVLTAVLPEVIETEPVKKEQLEEEQAAIEKKELEEEQAAIEKKKFEDAEKDLKEPEATVEPTLVKGKYKDKTLSYIVGKKDFKYLKYLASGSHDEGKVITEAAKLFLDNKKD